MGRRLDGKGQPVNFFLTKNNQHCFFPTHQRPSASFGIVFCEKAIPSLQNVVIQLKLQA